MSVLYGLPLKHVLGLDRSCADMSGGRLRTRLNGDWVVNEPVARPLRVERAELYPSGSKLDA